MLSTSFWWLCIWAFLQYSACLYLGGPPTTLGADHLLSCPDGVSKRYHSVFGKNRTSCIVESDLQMYGSCTNPLNGCNDTSNTAGGSVDAGNAQQYYSSGGSCVDGTGNQLLCTCGGIGAAGADLGAAISNTENGEACRLLCVNHQECRFANYVKATKSCQLMKACMETQLTDVVTAPKGGIVYAVYDPPNMTAPWYKPCSVTQPMCVFRDPNQLTITQNGASSYYLPGGSPTNGAATCTENCRMDYDYSGATVLGEFQRSYNGGPSCSDPLQSICVPCIWGNCRVQPEITMEAKALSNPGNCSNLCLEEPACNFAFF